MRLEFCPEFHGFPRIGGVVSEMIDSQWASRRAHELPPCFRFQVQSLKFGAAKLEPVNLKRETPSLRHLQRLRVTYNSELS